MKIAQPLRVGIGGPVGSGKTALTLALCRELRDRYELAVVTNDIYTEEDAQFLVRNDALPADRILGVETGGCPHTAIREDASINLEAVDRLAARFGNLDIVFVESGGDNLAAAFSPELVRLIAVAFLEVGGGAEVLCREHLAPFFRSISDYLEANIENGRIRNLDPMLMTTAMVLTTFAQPEITALIKNADGAPN